MTKRNLRLADADDNVTPADVERARMEQSWREWHGPNGKPWMPYDGPTGKSADDVGEITRRQYRVVVTSRVSWWRRVWRWVTHKTR